ncbi:MAG TPA: hypothetical protein VH196_00920 [Terriglobales bacterium]|nr:hypothetical protein [Terriglobales bacterium]
MFLCELAKFVPFINSSLVFSRRISVEYESNGQRKACQLKWLDSFSMRNFTNDAMFDDTLPVSDGLMEIGSRVPLEALRTAMQDWFQRKSYLEKAASLVVKELA